MPALDRSTQRGRKSTAVAGTTTRSPTLAIAAIRPSARPPVRRGGRTASLIGAPVEARILSIDAWSPHVEVGERYRVGRVFLVGDAAHRFPPTGGLGVNTGIAAVEAGAPTSRLEDYERACRPAARTNAEASFENLLRLGEISRVPGDCANLAALETRLGALTQEERSRLAEAIERQRPHFEWQGARPTSLAADPNR